MVKFRARVRDGGNSYVITIPKALVEANVIPFDKEFEFEATEVQDG